MKFIIAAGLIAFTLFLSGCTTTEPPVACTDDAMQCPDGSLVSRVPPSCEFAQCPDVPPPDGCTEDARVCPDGTVVVRVPPECEFAECPEVQPPVFCTADVMQCPDGSYVSRVPPTCEFAPCPGVGDEDVILTTSKNIYTETEIVELEIQNNSEDSIFFYTGCAVDTFLIQKKTGENFEKVFDYDPTKDRIICQALPLPVQVNSGETESLNWSIPEKFFNSQGEELSIWGTYKLSLTYYVSEGGIFVEDFAVLPTNSIQSNEFTISVPTLQNQEECEADGGEWNAHCGLIRPCCNYRTNDFGNECTDGGDCEGVCMFDEESSEDALVGTCSEWKTQFGCFTLMTAGEIGPILCID